MCGKSYPSYLACVWQKKWQKKECYTCFALSSTADGSLSLYYVWAHVKWNPEQLRGALSSIKERHRKVVVIFNKGLHFLRLPENLFKASVAVGPITAEGAFGRAIHILLHDLLTTFEENDIEVERVVFLTMPAFSPVSNGLPRIDRLDGSEMRLAFNEAAERGLRKAVGARQKKGKSVPPIYLLDLFQPSSARFTKDVVYGLHFGPTARPHISNTNVNRTFILLLLHLLSEFA
uniref:Uncharacterized protein n=1 Tax=Palpitomonas bilix TaxID=652834 RepID=A0A7S3D1S7_9EUKA|mmetsp:Transcript_18633/g.46982  ORF Transcript_18633/g.46982 Transcript_18633/m.46982 type:complete len:233 (+) Transcript_18633:265-963(+)